MATNTLEVVIEGLPELMEKLDPDKLYTKPARDALTKSALLVEGQAKRNASGRPGPMVRTGRLRSSITHIIDPMPLPMWAAIGTNVIYARPVEFGTHRSKAYPYLYPALDQKKSEIESLVKEAAEAMKEHWQR